MPKATRVLVVCLPETTPTDKLTSTATRALAAVSTADRATPVGHFLARTRWRRRQLLQPRDNTAAGGPLNLLDLDTMRAEQRTRYWQRWHVWQRVVHGTRPAQPFWTFAARHRADPRRYPLDLAQQHYLAQPRIAAMRTYNMLPGRLMDLPTNHLEALQSSLDAYAYLGWLAAVPAHALVSVTGGYLTPATESLADLQAYLARANTALAQLDNRDRLVALACY